MEKPTIATNLDGFLIDHSAFIEPHKNWFDRAISLTKNDSLKKWKGHPEYFKGVNEAMEMILPKASKEERNTKARNWYQEDVIDYISKHPETIKRDLAESLKKLKPKFKLALITTNTKEYIGQILKVANLERIYDIIFASSANEEPKKQELFNKFKREYGSPKYYIASRSEEPFEMLSKLGTTCIYFVQNEINHDIKNLASQTISSVKELENLI